LQVITRIATAAPRGFHAAITSSINAPLYCPCCGSMSAQLKRIYTTEHGNRGSPRGCADSSSTLAGVGKAYHFATLNADDGDSPRRPGEKASSAARIAARCLGGKVFMFGFKASSLHESALAPEGRPVFRQDRDLRVGRIAHDIEHKKLLSQLQRLSPSPLRQAMASVLPPVRKK
jgi:hypothetical protein